MKFTASKILPSISGMRTTAPEDKGEIVRRHRQDLRQVQAISLRHFLYLLHVPHAPARIARLQEILMELLVAGRSVLSVALIRSIGREHTPWRKDLGGTLHQGDGRPPRRD